MSLTWFFAVLSLTSSFGLVSSLNILILFPIESRSMRNIVQSLASGLHQQNHQVTIMGMYPGNPKDLPEGISEITIPEVWDHYTNLTNSFFTWSRDGPMTFSWNFYDFFLESSQKFLDHPTTKSWAAQHTPTYDVAIINAMSCNYAIPIACHVARRCMLLLPTELTPWLSRSMGLPNPISYVPSSVRSNTVPLGFLERTYNSIGYGLVFLMFEWYTFSRWNEQVRERFPQLKSIEQATDEDVAMMMVNVDPVVTVQKPGIPRVVNVGCLHCKEAQALHGELLEFVENSGKDGFILFSLGSVVKGSSLSKTVLDMFISTFSKLKRRVVWKFEKELDKLPENVKIFRWLPQQDILGHPNIRLFITHGGLLSMEETVFHGVPVIAFPIFAEQPGNAARVVEKGMGSILDIHTVTEEILLNTINGMIEDQSFMENAKKYSAIARDQPSLPVDRAIYWVEYVARHSDVSHLKMGGFELNLIQYFSIDIMACLLLAPIICFCIGFLS